MEEHRVKSVTLAVEGMHCESCAEKLRLRLAKSPGVRQAAVSFAERQARILYDPGATSDARLAEEIGRSGFGVGGPESRPAGGSARDGGGLPAAGGIATPGWHSTLLAVPAILASLIPSVTCPLCITAYADLLSKIGLGFLMSSGYLLPLTASLLAVALDAIGYEAEKRGAWGPFVLCACGSVLVLVGKFALGSEATTYTGVALMLAASIWNLIPRLRNFRDRSPQPRTAI
jgi:copper chaperone CopZ